MNPPPPFSPTQRLHGWHCLAQAVPSVQASCQAPPCLRASVVRTPGEAVAPGRRSAAAKHERLGSPGHRGMLRRAWLIVLAAAAGLYGLASVAGTNLVQDPSFEEPKEKDRFGFVFAKWGGWKYEGDCDFAVGRVARTGTTSGLLVGGSGAKIRIAQNLELEPGRYRITAYLRGLDISTGTWNMTTEFMFNGKYIQLKKNGTFGWTKLTYVGETTEKKKAGPSFGLMAPGYFWIDDVTMEQVDGTVALTEAPVLGEEEAPIVPPGAIAPGFVRCGECGYRSMPDWRVCYACGTDLDAQRTVAVGPPVKVITSFEDENPFSPGTLVEEHATDGAKALRIDKSYVSMDAAQDWIGYDYLMADLYTDAAEPMSLYVEVRDKGTTGYWTRVNYTTVTPPGASTLIIPVKQLYVGEKSRPGRMLMLGDVTRLVFSIPDKPEAPLFVDNVRLEREEESRNVLFDGLHAFDFGSGSSPVLEGFTAITPATLYSQGRGYGLKDAKIWRTYDVLQPEPLYQDFVCIESGGLAVDVPNGTYRVFVNMDNPSGFWGEYQRYRERGILAEGKEVVTDALDFEAFRKKYFRFWDVEDLPTDSTFDKYQEAYYGEKVFDVEVADGQLNIDFRGANWACSVAAVVVFPVAKAEQGAAFLHYVVGKRRFHFDNYFKRVLHRATGDPLDPTAADRERGYVVFQRDLMEDVYYNDTPRADEPGRPLAVRAFTGEHEPVTFSVLPLRDLGKVTVVAGDLVGAGGTVPAGAIDVGSVSYRISRVTMEGSVYSIRPRLITPADTVDGAKGMVRRFWLTIRTPTDAEPGLYSGKVSVRAERGGACDVPVALTVLRGRLDPVDLPVGPWGHTIGIPWDGRDPDAAAWNSQMTLASLRKLRDYGFTSFSGLPSLSYRGFKDGKPVIDFSRGDAQMAMAREAGFTMPVVSYCAFPGLDLYYQSTRQMQQAGFTDYDAFVKSVFGAVQEHAEAGNWLPVYWNLGDEPIGDNLKRSAVNAEAYHKAFPEGPPFFTAASSFSGDDPADPHFVLAKDLHVANWNSHSEASVRLLQEAGGDWAFYNGGNRWTFGVYMYKAAKQFGMEFRLAWHWNCVAGDPYYALDCREDDYAWCNSNPAGELVPSVHFERLREGLDDYRRMLTLARLAQERKGTAAAGNAERLLSDILGPFRLGDRALKGVSSFRELRAKLDTAIETLR